MPSPAGLSSTNGNQKRRLLRQCTAFSQAIRICRRQETPITVSASAISQYSRRTGISRGKPLMAQPINSRLTGDIWHLSIDDLLAPTAEPARLGGPGPFVINLSASTAPISLPVQSIAGSDRAHVYQLQRVEDGRMRYRLRLGPFEREDDADQLLLKVRDLYPGAVTANAGSDDLRAIELLHAKIDAQQARSKKRPAVNPTAVKNIEAPAEKAVPRAAAKPPDFTGAVSASRSAPAAPVSALTKAASTMPPAAATPIRTPTLAPTPAPTFAPAHAPKAAPISTPTRSAPIMQAAKGPPAAFVSPTATARPTATVKPAATVTP